MAAYNTPQLYGSATGEDSDVNLQPVWTIEDDTIVYRYYDLPKYNNDGELYIYTVTEVPVDGYKTVLDGNTIINYEVTEIDVTKDWIDINETHTPPGNAKVTFALYKNSETEPVGVIELDGAVDDALTEKDSGEHTAWIASFRELQKYDDNNDLIVYTVKEAKMTIGETTFTVTEDGGVRKIDTGDKTYVVTEGSIENNEAVITNTESGISINVTKKWVKDGTELIAEQIQEKAPISFVLHQVLSKDGIEKQDRVFTGIPGHPDGVFTISYDSERKDWEIVSIRGLKTVDTATVTDGNGETTTVENCDASYYVVETDVTADAGYNLAITYSQKSEADDPVAEPKSVAVTDNNATITIVNSETPGTPLPATGGSGTLIYTIAGMALIVLAGVLLVSRRKRRT